MTQRFIRESSFQAPDHKLKRSNRPLIHLVGAHGHGSATREGLGRLAHKFML